jgi:hypothetical protein
VVAGRKERTFICSGLISPSTDEERLNRIMIKCPKTGKLVYTGFAMDAQTFDALPIEDQDPIQCPACNQMHRWKKRDAIFERTTPPGDR